VSRYLIDTNVVSELRKGDRANGGVRDWFDQNIESDMWLSVLVAGELQRGVALIERRDPVAAQSLRDWLDALLDVHREQLLDVDLDVVDRWSALGVPDPVPVVDGLLAATALAHDLVLVTRNTNDLERTGARVLNPFTSQVLATWRCSDDPRTAERPVTTRVCEATR